jgi:hypothetical protein
VYAEAGAVVTGSQIYICLQYKAKKILAPRYTGKSSSIIFPGVNLGHGSDHSTLTDSIPHTPHLRQVDLVKNIQNSVTIITLSAMGCLILLESVVFFAIKCTIALMIFTVNSVYAKAGAVTT